MAKVLRLSTGFFDGLAENLAPGDRERASDIISGLLNGLSIEDIAKQLSLKEENVRNISKRIRASLQVANDNQRALIPVAFDRGVDVAVSEADISCFHALDEDYARALDGVAKGFNNDSLCGVFGKNISRSAINRVSALVTRSGKAMVPGVELKRQSLLPAFTYRAVELYLARLQGKTSFLENTNVELGAELG